MPRSHLARARTDAERSAPRLGTRSHDPASSGCPAVPAVVRVAAAVERAGAVRSVGRLASGQRRPTAVAAHSALPGPSSRCPHPTAAARLTESAPTSGSPCATFDVPHRLVVRVVVPAEREPRLLRLTRWESEEVRYRLHLRELERAPELRSRRPCLSHRRWPWQRVRSRATDQPPPTVTWPRSSTRDPLVRHPSDRVCTSPRVLTSDPHGHGHRLPPPRS